ncbi:MAG: molybdopterin-synthase adenylyltransferase MoeB [Oceanospirillaceae bacterium]|nr:molybdopterin-synthase adenylyltransferase MoeB [Oceanospirillaceae bacterium]MCP5350690.1 molybdopterin-synthase adenylyltransferase MoeB [Oceanospirillaceae bacterium]
MQDEELLRYSRHILINELDYAGQERLCQAHVLIMGLGGLGSPAAMYLAAAGVGTLTLVDFDKVEISNLQRQVIHGENTLGLPKVESAKQRIGQLNSACDVRALNRVLEENELAALVADADLVLDCTDNFPTRFMINQVCLRAGKPLVIGAAIRWEGQLMVVDPAKPELGCYQCVYPEVNEEQLTCAEAGIVGPVVGIIGTQQALLAIRMLTGAGGSAAGSLTLFDGLNGEWRKMKLRQNKKCPVCAQAAH